MHEKIVYEIIKLFFEILVDMWNYEIMKLSFLHRK